MQKTFLMIKPDGVQRGLIADIIGRFEKRGFKLIAMKMLKPSTELAQAHYAEHKEKPFFGGLVNFLTSGPVIAMVWAGENVISVARTMMGQTKPALSAPGTIRGDFAVNMGRNVIHGSAIPEDAEREIALWFKEEEIADWERSNDKHIYE